jgi:exopolyphosphatase/guanosine-5'-triphosphate,3'-diphosphate pyrophosphatase
VHSTTPTPGSARDHVAAVDLGSNSFHLVIARQGDHDLRILDRRREPVRLAEGLAPGGEIRPEVQERAIACLQRFGERLQGIPPHRVRAVGTNTLRLAKRSPSFRNAARAALGHTIEVISGVEEARLIYLGVAHTIPARRERRLVVDIGGGSTELIRGRGFEVELGASLFMGCVNYSRRFFGGGRIDRDRFRQAQTAAQLEVRAIEEQLREGGWDRCIGASGTVLAISEVLRQSGWTHGEITQSGMKKLRKALVQAGHADAIDLPGLKSDRRPVIAGGLAILLAIFKRLKIDRTEPSPGALREGVLYDLLGRIQHEDVRDRTIRRMVEQYRVDVAQSNRVLNTVRHLLDQAEPGTELDGELARRTLTWAAQLHEIGLAVAHTGYHKHGAYLLAESDMPGFSRDDQQVLSAIVRGHRRKLRIEYFDTVADDARASAVLQCLLLRLAVLLNRSRRPGPEPTLHVDAENRAFDLRFGGGWLEEHPLTIADLDEEARQWKAVGWTLTFGHESPEPAR